MTSPLLPRFAPLRSVAFAVLALGATGCNALQSTPAVSTITVDTGAMIPLSPGMMDAIDVEYWGGGHWEVHTTCDGQNGVRGCGYNVFVKPAPGSKLSQAAGEGLNGNSAVDTQPDGSLELITATGETMIGMSFETDPGVEITVNANSTGDVSVVSHGAVVTGAPTADIDLVPSSP